MNAGVVRAEPRSLPAWLFALAGLGLLTSRVVPGARTAPVEALMFGAIAIGSLTGARTREGAHVRPPVVVAIGLAALVLARVAGGTPIPTPAAPLLTVGLDLFAAVAEEAFFRRFLYARLLPSGPVTAVAVTGLLFAAIHVPLYGTSVFWVDLGAGLLFGWQRWASGSWLAPATTHAAANLLVILR